jgi:hypothetical protein
MKLNPEDYAHRTRDPKWEQELARELRSRPEEERLEFISEMASMDLTIAMLLARGCLQKHSSFEKLLDLGLEHADASSIQWWLKAIVPRVGIWKMLRWLKARREKDPVKVGCAAYMMWVFKGQMSDAQVAETQDLMSGR